jgi:uncharacterized membrane protein YbhN (UPF0104 family)
VKKYWRLVGSATLVGLLIWRVEWTKVASAFVQLDATYWLLALGLYFAIQGVSALRWQMLGRMLGLGGSWREYLTHYFVGMFFNLVLPTSVGGDVVRAWYLGRQEGEKPATGRRTAAFVSVLADRINGFAVLIAVACVAALCCPTTLPRWIVWTVAGLGAACAAGLVALPLLPRLRSWLPSHPRLTRIYDAADLCLRDRLGMLWISLLSVLVQVGNILLAWLIGVGMGLQIPGLYYGVLIPLVSILTLLPISLNGMGLREVGTVVLLEPLGVESATAVTLSLLMFAVYTTASLMGGLVYLLGRAPRFQAAEAGREAQSSYTAFSGTEASGDADPVGNNSDQGRRGESTSFARTAASCARPVVYNGGRPSPTIDKL